MGDVTRQVEESLGELVNTRTSEEDYITAYQNGGLVIYTFKLTGKARQIEITEFLADKIADPNLKDLLNEGGLDEMRELFGEEQGMIEDEDIYAPKSKLKDSDKEGIWSKELPPLI